MNVFVRMARSLPLVAVLALLAVAVYVVVSWRRSPNQAKETLIRLFTVLTGGLTVLFALASLYAWLDGNANVLELAVGFAVVSAAALAITRLCRWSFVRNHPNYRFKPTRTWHL